MGELLSNLDSSNQEIIGWLFTDLIISPGCKPTLLAGPPSNNPPITGGTTVIISNTPDEYIYDSTGIPAQNVFSGEDLNFVVNDLGYNTVDIAGAYLHTTQTIISFSEGIYAGNIELLTVTGNLAKQSSSTFNVCRRSLSIENNYKNYSIDEDLKESFK